MKMLFYEPRERGPEPIAVPWNEPRPPSAVAAPIEDLPWYLWRVDKKNNVVKR